MYYDIAIVVTVDAGSYAEALELGKAMADGIMHSESQMDNSPFVSSSCVTDFEHDNDDQRVLYLHKES